MNYRGNRTLLVSIGALTILMLLGWALWQSLYRPPYVMSIKPAGDSSVVQFIQRQSRDGPLISPGFKVRVEVSQDSQVELTSSEMEIPGGEIQFADVTTTPGRFTLRFGDQTIDVMEAHIVVDGVSHGWAPQE